MSDILGYRGKRVIVSGCYSGMGEATARLLLSLGAEVHGLDYKESALALASFCNADLRDPASIEAGVAKIGGKIDALFNCAGLPQSFPALDVMKVNFIGTRHLTEQVIPLMAPGGAIASIASTGGLGWSRRIPTNMEFVTTKGFRAALDWCSANKETVAEGYSFSKENVIVWTQYMGAHLIKQGIRINCTLPSPTQTPMMAQFEAAAGKAVIEAATQPMGRYSTAEEQAGGIVLLNSALAGIVNGVVFPVDGGFMGGVATGQVDLSVMMRRAK
jgi:NAD(P)-dependent dehydrogenase (short-subunit alcohol dehydrogenase family)